MRQRTFPIERHLIERQIERWVLHVKLCITRPDFARLDPEEAFVKIDACGNIVHIDSQMGL